MKKKVNTSSSVARRSSVRGKLMKLIAPLVLVMVFVLILIADLSSTKRIRQMATDELTASVANQAESINSWMDENLADFSSVKHLIEQTQPGMSALQHIIDATYGYNSNAADGLHIGTATGKVIKPTKSSYSAANPEDSTWFKQGTTSVSMHFGSAYDDGYGNMIISATGMLDDGSDELKVIGADLSLNKISTIVNSGVKMTDAKAMLIDTNDNTILASPDITLSGKKLGKNSTSPLLKGIAGNIATMNYNNSTIAGNLVAFKQIEGTDWLLVSYVPAATIFSGVRQMTNILIFVGILAAIIISISIYFVVKRVTAPISDITENITAMTNGDFTIHVTQKSNDEIGAMSGSVAKFVERMRGMLSQINAESDRLKKQSDSSDEVSKSMLNDSKSQSEAMKNLNDTVDQLSKAVNDIAQNATTLAMVVSDTKDKSSKAGDSMKSTVELSQKGRDDMKSLSEAMVRIEKTNNELVSSIGEVGSASEEITKIVEVISEIADETNLLSLNASIEAARAGESGKGFAVVASQIGSLASNSADSAENISKLIGKVKSLISKVVDQANNSAESIKENTELINTAVSTFDDIYKNIQQSDNLIQEMAADVDKVNDVAANVAAISEEQAASSDEILKTSEDMVEKAENITRSSQEVKDNSKELADTSDTLTGYVNKFKI
ncbi:MAG: methyl-accepting chemotaxis protein [Lachnospiraceae bacterium]|uniref:Methyl-accepting chemotaxis protein n=1 Tax=Candidatus Weimeria bifida TaxID=2599074 RepID=A0A6N7IZG5_9FIRM|nr:methyl-accepting chemotaxis protein [Candidatus Weimeria bifida]RRF95774.1 MAG: methyl-accepting chemotaxis protein [Lachnospiraceae bacterium]